MTRFNTLLLREWMQYRRGWLILTLALPVLFLLILPFGTVEFRIGDLGPLPVLGFMLAGMLTVPMLLLGVAVVTMLFQTPGLARRDDQDRSIEFWLSLPVGHATAIAATVLAHALLMPLGALAIGALLGPLVGMAVVVKAFGPASLASLPWDMLPVIAAAGFLRAVLGVVLGFFWLLPLILLAMAAAAWLKRWGTPVLAIALALGHKLLATFYGVTVIGDTVTGLLLAARGAMINNEPSAVGGDRAFLAWLANAPQWLLHDAMDAVRDLAQPLALVAIVLSAIAFGLLVLRRSRGD